MCNYIQEYLQALTDLAPDSVSRLKSVEAAKQATLQLEAVRHRLEAERADQEDKMKMEREGIVCSCGFSSRCYTAKTCEGLFSNVGFGVSKIFIMGCKLVCVTKV